MRVHVREVSVSLVVPEIFTRVIPVEKKFADDASVRRRIKRKREGSVEEDNKRTQADTFKMGKTTQNSKEPGHSETLLNPPPSPQPEATSDPSSASLPTALLKVTSVPWFNL